MTWADDLSGLTAADVMHRHLSTVGTDATVGELRAYFAASSSRRLALIADGPRYVGAVAADTLPQDADDDARAALYAAAGPTLAPGDEAEIARTRGLQAPSRRLPVVDEGGTLIGIVAINKHRDDFCGT